MDTLFWTQCSPNIRVQHTTKKYYGKYLCKLVVYAPAGRLIESKDDISVGIDYRRQLSRNVNYGGSWWASHQSHQQKLLDDADANFLDFLRSVRNTRGPEIKLRIEEPLIQIYGSTEEVLKELINNHFWPSWSRKYIESISAPVDTETAELLNNGAIIRKTENGFRYKVLVKDGHYGVAAKESIRQYLQGVGLDNAYMPNGFEKQLLKGNYVWSGYFYINDLSLLSFLELIHPGMVTNFHELVVQPHK